MMPEIIIPEHLAKELESYLEFHMSNCFDTLYSDDVENIEGWDGPFDSFCGCFTCESREWLMATFAFLKNAGIVDVYVGE
jgi:hypothetical protein